MRIAIFTDSFFPGVGGTEKAVYGLANELAKTHDVAIFCPKYDGRDEDEYNFEIYRSNSIIVGGEYYGLPAFTKNYAQQLKDFNPDVIHCHTVSSLTRFALWHAKKHNVPAIMTVHTKFREAFGRVVKAKPVLDVMLKDIAKKAYKCNRVFTVSNDMGIELEGYGYGGSYEIIRNGSMFQVPENLQELSELADEKYGLENKIVFLFVGLLVQYKNIQFSLNALKKFKETNPNFKFVIVGGGPEEEYFKDLVKELELEENVVFTGLIRDKAELSMLYARADLFLFPSIFDNDPLTIVEAASHKTPALTLENTGSSERIEPDKTGFVVENNLEAYINKIVEVTKDLEALKQIGENASKHIPKTWEEIASEYEKHYEELIEEGREFAYSKKQNKKFA